MGKGREPRPVTAYIGLGANLGDRRATIRRALDLLRAGGVRLRRVSQLIETEPVGGPPGQPKFLNGAAEVVTCLRARELLRLLLDAERMLGRRRSGVRDEPRPIDLDLLLYGSDVIRRPGLIVPHPRMQDRMFVLVPLRQIAPRVVHPVLGKTILRLAGELEDAYKTGARAERSARRGSIR